MLLSLREYHLPADEGTTGGLERDLELLSCPGLRTAPLAGGGDLAGSGDPSVESVVDLQRAGPGRLACRGRAAYRAIHPEQD